MIETLLLRFNNWSDAQTEISAKSFVGFHVVAMCVDNNDWYFTLERGRYSE